VAEHGFSGGKTKDGKKEDPLALIREHTMRHPVEALRDMAKRIATVVLEAKLPVDVDEYIARFATGLVDIVYDWCRGAKFADICRLTDAYEGSIIRALHRLEELLRQLIDAARVVGNEQLQSKCEQAQKLLVRDVVFCPSLYT
jgi:ATP-dependent RNA helicase DOB1